MKKITVVMMAIVAAAQVSFAQKPSVVTSNEEGWQKIGETTVSFKEEDESIMVIGADEFSALKLKVTDASIKIERLQVFYESGDMQELEVESELSAGSESQEFQLEHEDRDIAKVAFTYKSNANSEGKRAHVELHGLKTDAQSNSNAYREQRDNAEQKMDSAGSGINRAMDNIENEVDSTGKDIERAAENIANEIDSTASDIENSVDRKSEQVDSAATNAGQELNDQAENIEDDVEDGADRIRNDVQQETDSATNEMSESAANTASGIADETSKDKQGPEGQTIYIDRSTKYYYINEEGKKVYIGKEQLKDKREE